MTALGNHRGSSFAIVLTATLLLAALGVSLAAGLATSHGRLTRALGGDRARYIARAGLEVACLDVLSPRADWTTLNSSHEWTDKELTPGSTCDVAYQSLGDPHRVQVDVTGRSGGQERIIEFVVERAGPGAPIHIFAVNDVSLSNLVR